MIAERTTRAAPLATYNAADSVTLSMQARVVMPSWSKIVGRPLPLALVALGLQAVAWAYFTGITNAVEVLATGVLVGTMLLIIVLLAGHLMGHLENRAKRRR